VEETRNPCRILVLNHLENYDIEDGQGNWPIIISGSFEMFPESLYL
jgi:hypothetical protein